MTDEQPMSRRKRTRQPLSSQQTELVRNMVERGMNLTQAAKSAGYAHVSSGHRALQRARLRVGEELDEIGYPAKRVLKELYLPLTKATETKFFSNSGVVMETREVPALDIRFRAATELLRMHEACARDSNEQGNNHGQHRSSQIAITLVLSDPRSANAIMAISTDCAAVDLQPGMDAGRLDEDEG